MHKNLFSNNNIKLGRLFSFSLPKSTCPTKYCKHCKKYCYSNMMFRLYPDYKPKMTYNLRASKHKDFIKRICYELKEAPLMVRLHVNGDFYDQVYLEKWFKIAVLNPHHVFYCYTKAMDLDFRSRPKNMIIYLSDDHLKLQQHYNRFDGVACISFDHEPIVGFKLCKYQDHGVKCSHCGICATRGNRIYFNKH